MFISLKGGSEDAVGKDEALRAIVRRTQIAFYARQLYVGPIEGIAGRVLRATLRKFKIQRSLAVTGTITY